VLGVNLMAAVIRMPSVKDLPRGPKRDLVEDLFLYYREAGRPTLRAVSDWISEHEELAGTASRETIRRMLAGTSVPAQWETANAVFQALCCLAGFDPDKVHPGWDESRSCRERFKDAWNLAIDAPEPVPADPWTDEPPF
jgi:hypothetical protein